MTRAYNERRENPSCQATTKMMNLIPMATFFIRLTGFGFLVDATINFTYLPEYLAAAGNAKPGSSLDLREFEVFMIIIRVLILMLLGIVFLVSSKRLAKVFTRGLLSPAPDQPEPGETWPPAPKNPGM